MEATSLQFIQLLVAMLLGGAIGTERAILAKQAAGTRTFGLVSMGACLFIIIGSAVHSSYLGVVNFEPLQIAGMIVTGVGFLGGGLIFLRQNGLHGVTTAAGLWLSAGVGMACGFGLFSIAVFATLLAFIMFTGMWYVEDKFKHWFEEQTVGM
jgi:putative Mg2+ transporter-C (MgtC) family protein